MNFYVFNDEKRVQIISKKHLKLMINDIYKDIKDNLKRRRTKGKRMQQLLKRFYDVIKVRIRFANSQFKKKLFEIAYVV